MSCMFFVHFVCLLTGGFMAFHTNKFGKTGVVFMLVLLLCACQSNSKLEHKEFYVDKSLYLDQEFPLYQQIKIFDN